MMPSELFSWTWWTKSTQGLLARIAIGAAIFAILATVDLVRQGKKATRWREYLFLVAGVALACGYGIINDQITSRISWEYFYYGKGLADVLGSRIPPDSKAMALAVVKVGIEATWTAGLIVSVALLIANNPRPNPHFSPPRLELGLVRRRADGSARLAPRAHEQPLSPIRLAVGLCHRPPLQLWG